MIDDRRRYPAYMGAFLKCTTVIFAALLLTGCSFILALGTMTVIWILAVLLAAAMAAVCWMLAWNLKPALAAIAYLVSLLGPILGLAISIPLSKWTEGLHEKNPYLTTIAAPFAGAGFFALLFYLCQLALGWQAPQACLYWSAGIFLFLFVLSAGASLVREQIDEIKGLANELREHFKGGKAGGGRRVLTLDRIRERMGKLEKGQKWNFLGLFVAPLLTPLLYQLGLFKAHNSFEAHFVVASAVMITVTLLSCIYLGLALADAPREKDFGTTEQQIKHWYTVEYEWRLIYFVDISHSVVICAIYFAAAYISTSGNNATVDWIKGFVAFAGTATVFEVCFVLIPFYFGQTRNARTCSRLLLEQTKDRSKPGLRDQIKKDVNKIRAPVPWAGSLRYLGVTLAAGGMATTVLGKALDVFGK